MIAPSSRPPRLAAEKELLYVPLNEVFVFLSELFYVLGARSLIDLV